MTSKSQEIPVAIKRKIAQRKRLLTKLKINPNIELKKRVKNLSNEIRHHFIMNKRQRVRRGITPGSSKSLWKAVAAVSCSPGAYTLGGVGLMSGLTG